MLNACGHQEKNERGDPQPSGVSPQRAAGARGDPRTRQHRNPPCGRTHDEEGSPQSQHQAQPARGQEGEGNRPRAPTACRPSLKEGGDPLRRQHGLPAHGTPAREGGDSPNQEEEEGAPPNQRTLPAHGMQDREGGGGARNIPRARGRGGRGSREGNGGEDRRGRWKREARGLSQRTPPPCRRAELPEEGPEARESGKDMDSEEEEERHEE